MKRRALLLAALPASALANTPARLKAGVFEPAQPAVLSNGTCGEGRKATAISATLAASRLPVRR